MINDIMFNALLTLGVPIIVIALQVYKIFRQRYREIERY